MKTFYDRKVNVAIAVDQVHRRLREITASGAYKYRAQSPNGDTIEVTLYATKRFGKSSQIYCRIWLTRYRKDKDGTITVEPCQYHLRRNTPTIERFTPDCTGKKAVYDRDATLGDLMDLNAYLRTWKEVPPHFR